MRLHDLKKFSKKKIIISIVIIVFIVGAGTAFVLMKKEGKEEQLIIDESFCLFLSTNDKNYTGGGMGLLLADPNTVEWRIYDKNNTAVIILSGGFPTSSGESGTITTNNATVTWLDQDNDGKLSSGDKIIIHTQQNNYNFDGYRFILISHLTVGTIADFWL